MKSTIKKTSDSEIELEIEIPKEELDDFISQSALSLGKNLEVEGFRKGKVPQKIIEEKVGRENILVDAADLAIKENYKKAVLENNLEVISEPKIEIIKLAPGNPLIFRAKASVLPEIKLPDYKKIAKKIKRKEVSVSEKEIDEALKWLQKSRTKTALKNSPAQKGDFVEIEYWSSQIKGLDKPEGRQDAFILGEGHFLPGFENKLIGMSAGEEKRRFSLVLPEKFPVKDLAGKSVDFQVRIKSVQSVEFPELNDEFAKSLGQFEDLSALKKNVREGLVFEKKQAETQRVRNEILEKISETMKCELPEALVEREQKAMMENFKKEVSAKLNIPAKEYLEKIKKTEEEMLSSFLEEAQKRIRAFLILRKVGEENNIEVLEEEVKKEVDKILKQYQEVKQPKDLDLERLKEYAKGVLRNEKTFALLESFIKN